MSGKSNEDKKVEVEVEVEKYLNILNVVCKILLENKLSFFEIQYMMGIIMCSFGSTHNVDVDTFSIILDSWKDQFRAGNDALDKEEESGGDDSADALIKESIH